MLPASPGPLRTLVAAVVVFGVVAGAAGATALEPVRVEPDVPVTSTDERLEWANNSPALAVDPTQRRFVVIAHRTDNPDFSCALQVSGDGGRGWVEAQPVPTLPEGAEKCYAPEVAFDREGVLYYLFVGLRGRGNVPMGVFVSTSTDRARTFSAPRQVMGPQRFMVRMALDRERGEMGRLHLVWLQADGDLLVGGLPSAANPILAAYSDDGGRTFSEPVQVSDPDRPRSVAPAVTLGPGGNIHVVYYDLHDDFRDYQGLEGPTWEGNWSVVASTSTDAGQTFGRGVVVDDQVVPPERVMLIFTMAPPSVVAAPGGELLVAWHDARNLDWDVFARRSPDGGRSWEGLLRVNDDGVGNLRHQYMPRLAVAPDGRIDVIFYDRRDDPENLRNHVLLASSYDAGKSFDSNVKLTTDTSLSTVGPRYRAASAAGLVEYGSRLALLSDGRAALAAWTDTRNSDADTAQQDIFVTEVEFASDSTGGLPLWAVAGAVTLPLAVAAIFVRHRRRPGAAAPEMDSTATATSVSATAPAGSAATT